MDDENRNRASILSAVRKHYNILPINNLRFDLSEFIIIKKGKYFHYLYTWKFLDSFNKMYLCSFRNSYETEGMNAYYFFEIDHVSGRYLGLLLESKVELPDLIIRPSTISDRVSNLFLGFDIKLDNRRKFNTNYILESNATKEECSNFLIETLTSLIEKEINFYLEIKDAKIFLKFEQEMQLQNTMSLIEIGLLIDEIIKNKVLQKE
jgi:hypothetical protein